MYLAVTSLSGTSVAGCGDSGPVNCESALQSKWAYWFVVPVSVPAGTVYAGLVAALLLIGSYDSSTRRLAWFALVLLSIMVSGAAIWFIALQIGWLGSICVYCLAVHACGLMISAFVFSRLLGHLRDGRLLLPAKTFAAALGAGFLGLAILLTGQLAATGPGMEISQPETLEPDMLAPAEKDRPAEAPEVASPDPVEPADGSSGEPIARTPSDEKPSADPPTDDLFAQNPVDDASNASTQTTEVPPMPSVEHQRRLLLRSGQSIDAFDYPCDGSPTADFVMVKLFDYTCPHCRSLHAYLKQSRTRYGDRLAFLLVPVPMHSKCNKHVQTDSKDHAAACALARLALSVWLADKEKFIKYHDWLFEPATPRSAEAARAEAIRLIGAAAINQHHDSSEINDRLEEATDLYNQLGRGVVPKLLYRGQMSTGKPNSANQLFLFIEKTMGLKPVSQRN